MFFHSPTVTRMCQPRDGNSAQSPVMCHCLMPLSASINYRFYRNRWQISKYTLYSFRPCQQNGTAMLFGHGTQWFIMVFFK